MTPTAREQRRQDRDARKWLAELEEAERHREAEQASGETASIAVEIAALKARQRASIGADGDPDAIATAGAEGASGTPTPNHGVFE